MKRLKPLVLRGPGGFIDENGRIPSLNEPPPKVDEGLVRSRLRNAGIGDEQHQWIIAELHRAVLDYKTRIRFDEESATPAQVREFVDRAVAVANDLTILLDASTGGARAIRQAMLLSGAIDGPALDALRIGAKKLKASASHVRAQVGQPVRGGGKHMAHSRQVRFARSLVRWFSANGWPGGTSANSLLAQILGACLKAAGEQAGKPILLLKDAANLSD